jgi:hypothetical protein
MGSGTKKKTGIVFSLTARSWGKNSHKKQRDLHFFKLYPDTSEIKGPLPKISSESTAYFSPTLKPYTSKIFNEKENDIRYYSDIPGLL